VEGNERRVPRIAIIDLVSLVVILMCMYYEKIRGRSQGLDKD
jgi:hypothetical protein